MNRKLISIILLIVIMCSLLSMGIVSAQTPKYSTISGGTLHCAVVKSDGSLWTWGYNCDGQLAISGTYSVTVPTMVMTDVASVSAGEWSTAILKNDGSLWMVGGNNCGQLGNGNTTSTAVPVKVLDNVSSVSTGGFFTAALKNDGSLWVWGDNQEGNILTPKKMMDGVVSVSTGGWHTAVIKNDGSLWMWGENTSGQVGVPNDTKISTPVKIMDDVADVSVGTSHTAVIKNDGSLWLWGDNENGRLGNGTKKDSSVPIKVMDDVASVSLGKVHSAAIKKDGSLWVWGGNWNGEVGNNDKKDVHVPTKIMDSVVSVELGYNHALAIKNDGSLWTWGANRSAQAGLGHTEYAVRVPTKIMENMMIPDKRPSNVVSVPKANTEKMSFGATVSNWAAGEIEKAFENNLIPETMLDVDLTQKVNRSEFAAIAIQLYEALSGEFETQSQYCDFSDISGDKNENAIKKAYELGVTSGTSKTKYEPYTNINREQLATMLCRVIKKSVDPAWTMETDANYPMDISGVQKFRDDGDISAWAKPSVYFMSKHGVIKGVSDTHFAPKNISMQQEASGYASATREQAIIITQRILMNIDNFN